MNVPSSQLHNPGRKMWSFCRHRLWLTVLVLLCVGIYVCDYLSVRYRIPKNREPFGAVKIRRYYAIRLKDGKTEFAFQEPETQVCVNALFPHFGFAPCWYAKRRSVKRIDL